VVKTPNMDPWATPLLEPVPLFSLPSSEEINRRYSFPVEEWTDRGNYYLNLAPQGSPKWHAARHNRLTASNFGAAVGHSTFSSPMEVVMDITGIKDKTFTASSKVAMDHGVLTEPVARDWYCHTRGVEVAEVGLAIPKWEPRIGASIDGDIVGTEGIIEVKSPKTMYKPLATHYARLQAGWVPPPFYHSHIWDSHYDQMQGSMRVTNKQWCEYIVYATESGRAYVERVPFNPSYWNDDLYPAIQHFLNTMLEPVLAQGTNCYLFHSGQ
jgi:putative phage-type endonuclease